MTSDGFGLVLRAPSLPPAARIDARRSRRHAGRFVLESPGAAGGVEALQEWSGLFGRGRDQVGIPLLHRLDRACPSRSIAELDQFSGRTVGVRMGSMEKHAGDDERRSRFETKRYLLRMGLVAHIGVGLRVEGEVTARDQAKRRARGG